jgi:hypothetical protein
MNGFLKRIRALKAMLSEASNFPAPGNDFHGLLMGSYIASDYLYTISATDL